MQNTATLVAAPGFGDLPALAATLARTLDCAPEWLEKDRAVDLPVASASVREITEEVIAAIGDAAVDHAVQPAFGRRKRVLIADMDSTFITVECIDVIARHAGIGAE